MKKSLLLVSLLAVSSAAVNAQDNLGYTPITEDFTANVPYASGAYINNGFSLALYGTHIDSQGFIDGPGDMINLEFYTAPVGDPEFSVAGKYEFYDTEAWMNKETDVKFGAGDLMGGFLYVIMPGYAIPMGTTVTIYDENLDETIGLAGPGSYIIVTDKGEGIYNIQVNIVTFQDAHVTAEWEGRLADFVQDFPVSSGIPDFETAADAVEYYNLQGVKVDAPLPGHVYIAVQGGSASKKIIK